MVSNDSIAKLAKGSFGIYLNANDFFYAACSDGVLLDPCDFEWAIPIIDKHGQFGVNAIMSFIRKEKPLHCYITDEFNEAYKELEDLDPEIWSD